MRYSRRGGAYGVPFIVGLVVGEARVVLSVRRVASRVLELALVLLLRCVRSLRRLRRVMSACCRARPVVGLPAHTAHVLQ